jgi:hypothetical protein
MSLQFTYTVYKSKTFHEFTIYLQSTNLRPSMSLQILDHLPWVYNLLTVYKSQTFHEFTIYLHSQQISDLPQCLKRGLAFGWPEFFFLGLLKNLESLVQLAAQSFCDIIFWKKDIRYQYINSLINFY